MVAINEHHGPRVPLSDGGHETGDILDSCVDFAQIVRSTTVLLLAHIGSMIMDCGKLDKLRSAGPVQLA